jgi:hypothetical protein
MWGMWPIWGMWLLPPPAAELGHAGSKTIAAHC